MEMIRKIQIENVETEAGQPVRECILARKLSINEIGKAGRRSPLLVHKISDQELPQYTCLRCFCLVRKSISAPVQYPLVGHDRQCGVLICDTGHRALFRVYERPLLRLGIGGRDTLQDSGCR